MVESHPANPGSCMAAGSARGSSCGVADLGSWGWPAAARRLGVRPHAFVRCLNGFDLMTSVDAVPNDLQFKTPFLFLRKMITQGTHYSSVIPQPLLTHQITLSAPQPISLGIAHVVWPQPAATKRNKLCQNRLVEYFLRR